MFNMILGLPIWPLQVSMGVIFGVWPGILVAIFGYTRFQLFRAFLLVRCSSRRLVGSPRRFAVCLRRSKAAVAPIAS